MVGEGSKAGKMEKVLVREGGPNPTVFPIPTPADGRKGILIIMRTAKGGPVSLLLLRSLKLSEKYGEIIK